MAYDITNPLGTTYQNATNAQMAPFDYQTLMNNYRGMIQQSQHARMVAQNEEQMKAQAKARENSRMATGGSLLGAALGTLVAPGLGTSIGAQMGGALMGKGAAPSPYVGAGLSMAQGFMERKNLQDLIGSLTPSNPSGITFTPSRAYSG